MFDFILFTLICSSVVWETLVPQALPVWQRFSLVDPIEEHRTWLEHIRRCRHGGLLGPLRMEERSGRPCVVGLGTCRPVQSLEEGVLLITRLKDQISATFH